MQTGTRAFINYSNVRHAQFLPEITFDRLWRVVAVRRRSLFWNASPSERKGTVSERRSAREKSHAPAVRRRTVSVQEPDRRTLAPSPSEPRKLALRLPGRRLAELPAKSSTPSAPWQKNIALCIKTSRPTALRINIERVFCLCHGSLDAYIRSVDFIDRRRARQLQ